MRSASSAPDLSSASSRVSETVSTAILSGTNCRVSSMPGMGGRLRPIAAQCQTDAYRQNGRRPISSAAARVRPMSSSMWSSSSSSLCRCRCRSAICQSRAGPCAQARDQSTLAQADRRNEECDGLGSLRVARHVSSPKRARQRLAARQLTGRLSLARRFLGLVLGARRPGPFDDQDDAGEEIRQP